MEKTVMGGRFPLVAPHWPVRRVVTRSGSILRGKFPSSKNGRMVAYEQLLEADALVLFEMSPFIRSYREQPERVYYPDGSRTRVYVPDFEVELLNGALVLIEVKPAKRLAAPELAHKFACVQQHMARLGRQFVILTDDAIRLQPRLANLRIVLRNSSAGDVTDHEMRSGMSVLTLASVKTLGEAIELVGKAIVFALLRNGIVRCNLDSEISQNTEIELVQGAENGWFYIARRHGF